MFGRLELDKSCFNLFTVEVWPKEYKKSGQQELRDKYYIITVIQRSKDKRENLEQR